VKLSNRTIDTIVQWAKRHPTIEVTGLVAQGAGGERVVPMRNVARRPEVYYEWDREEMAEVWATMDELGEEPVVFYHSHPNGRVDPSERDMEGALMEGMHHLILYPSVQGWSYGLWECIDAGILIGAQLEVVP
jgi:proteasome lid subunit RPN8/RPN11